MSRLPRFSCRSALLLAACSILCAPPAHAVDWRLYTSPLQNFGVASSGVGGKHEPAACSDGRGGMWVAYWDQAGSSDAEIMVRRVAPDAGGDHLRTVTADTFDQDQPQVATSDSGGVYVVWRDTRNAATTGDDIYIQYVGPEGFARWGANGVQVTNAAGSQQTPFVGQGPSGIIVGWLDDRNGSANSEIYFTRVSKAGVVSSLSGSALVPDPTDPTELSGTPAIDGLLLTWRDPRGGTADIYGTYINSFGTDYWTTFAEGEVCVAAGTQRTPRAASDDVGGGFVAWEDVRGSDPDIYIQRMSDFGLQQYGTGGAVVCDAAGIQWGPEITSDGAGGAIVAWLDDRSTPRSIYAQRITANGAGAWTADGVDVATGMLGAPSGMRIIGDGLGGAFIVWSEARVSGTDLYGQRLSASGAIQWGSGGVLISGAHATQQAPALALGSENSLLAAWEDDRSESSWGLYIYGQRVDRYGYLGSASPKLVDVSDVLGDQGGQVRLDWTPGYVEFDPYLQVASYYVLREVPAALAARMERAGARLVREPAEPAKDERVILAQANGTAVTYWEYVGQSPAFQSDTYSFVAPTTSDSVPGVPASTQWMLQARNSTGSRYWFSNVRVGHSVDNLAPLAPAPFAGTYASGSTRLTWNPNHEADLAGYRLYRGTTAGFVPGPGNLVAALPDTGYVDAGGAPYVYKLTAVDIHQNESPVATLLPANTVDVDANAPAELSFAPPSPNPASGSSTLRYALPREARVRLALYDAAGREVRTLVDAAQSAGAQAATWDLRDAGGRAVAPGLYFARFEAEGRSIVRRIAIVR